MWCIYSTSRRMKSLPTIIIKMLPQYTDENLSIHLEKLCFLKFGWGEKTTRALNNNIKLAIKNKESKTKQLLCMMKK